MNTSVPMSVLLEHFKWNLERLAEVLQNEKSDYFRDAALQRFGFTLESTVKCIQSSAMEESVPCESVNSSLQWAEQKGYLKGNIPREIIEETYQSITSSNKEADPNELYGRLPAILSEFQYLIEKLTQRTPSDS